jgi:transcription-repair coupling factor (superfamily II helicase)
MNIFPTISSSLPVSKTDKKNWNGLLGGSKYLAIAEAVLAGTHTTLLICNSNEEVYEAESCLSIYLKDQVDILNFPDWETLPYDQFSPHQDIISQRLETLSKLDQDKRALLICSSNTLMHKLPPREFVRGQSFSLSTGETINTESFCQQLVDSGYRNSDTVFERGEFARRGSILDLFPMGAANPIRIELFDNEIETLRTFDADNQRTIESLTSFKILPAKEFPFDDQSISKFKQAWQTEFDVDYRNCPIYQDIKNKIIPNGIEYYLDLFFERTDSLFDYLPQECLVFYPNNLHESALNFWQDVEQRFESLRWDVTRPLLSPNKVFLNDSDFNGKLKNFSRIAIDQNSRENNPQRGQYSFPSKALPELSADYKKKDQLQSFRDFYLELNANTKILICAQTAGRREQVLELFKKSELHPKNLESIQHFFDSKENGIFITVADIPIGSWVLQQEQALILLTEFEIYGHQVSQQRKKGKADEQSADLIIKNLSELAIDAPVVHIDHGVGRYRGLENLQIDSQSMEFLCLEYANKSKLYVPVSSLHLISRYSGGADDSAPLHSLGSDQWIKARKKAAEKIHDVAAELLDIYARRASVKGFQYSLNDQDYLSFAKAFPFEETDDQQNAIDACLSDLKSENPMDRLVCGDVGFGKTEVAMRAAFVALQNNKQVAILVPTTLLADQHGETFQDRFADWPVRIESLSRFKSTKESKEIVADLKNGKVDIVVGTHKILQKDIVFKDLGLIIIDEEHRFGVKHKEQLKSIRSNVDILTLTATPIPRTLNMAMSGIRDISIIATPPAKRLSIKTFVHTTSNAVIQEAIHRELLRGGQVFYLHNEVSTIEKTASDIKELIPEARVSIAHGQMREKQLENVMSDFYHKQSNVLVCTTIIETGIDIPSANTIIIDRADKLGLAQLHQLRGRVGRSHHQAYAYLLTPHHKAMSKDALKRLDAIQEATNLGAGFTLASHDLEIRGAGELLGDEQSGNMHAIGFTLYMEMLEEAVQSIKLGITPDLDKPLKHGIEINLSLPALIPDDYLPDVHLRLILYKRISSAKNKNVLSEIQVEMIDRFGMLPEQVKLLIRVTQLKLKAEPLGIEKIDASNTRGKIKFSSKPNIDPLNIVKLVQAQPQHYKMEGADKLQFIFDMTDYDDRIEQVNELLDKLVTPTK